MGALVHPRPSLSLGRIGVSSSSTSSTPAQSPASRADTPSSGGGGRTPQSPHAQQLKLLHMLKSEKATLKAKLRAIDDSFRATHGRSVRRKGGCGCP